MENQFEEKWIPIKGYEREYAISDKGNFAMIKRYMSKLVWHTEYIPKKTTVNRSGHHVITLSKEGIKKTFYAHRLIAEHLIPNPEGLKIVEHKDDNPANNSLDNLFWSTYKSNNINNHYRSGKHQIKTVLQYDLNGNFIKEHSSAADAQRSFNNSPSGNIIAMLNNTNRKSAYGFVWKYKE